MVVGSRHPRRAAAWYRWALQLPGPGGTLDAGGVDLVICRRCEVAPAPVEPGRLVANFFVDDGRAAEARLVAMGVTWIRELERTPWGLIGTVLDPDGNYVQIIERSRKVTCP